MGTFLAESFKLARDTGHTFACKHTADGASKAIHRRCQAAQTHVLAPARLSNRNIETETKRLCRQTGVGQILIQK